MNYKIIISSCLLLLSFQAKSYDVQSLSWEDIERNESIEADFPKIRVSPPEAEPLWLQLNDFCYDKETQSLRSKEKIEICFQPTAKRHGHFTCKRKISQDYIIPWESLPQDLKEEIQIPIYKVYRDSHKEVLLEEKPYEYSTCQ